MHAPPRRLAADEQPGLFADAQDWPGLVAELPDAGPAGADLTEQLIEAHGGENAAVNEITFGPITNR